MNRVAIVCPVCKGRSGCHDDERTEDQTACYHCQAHACPFDFIRECFCPKQEQAGHDDFEAWVHLGRS